MRLMYISLFTVLKCTQTINIFILENTLLCIKSFTVFISFVIYEKNCLHIYDISTV